MYPGTEQPATDGTLSVPYRPLNKNPWTHPPGATMRKMPGDDNLGVPERRPLPHGVFTSIPGEEAVYLDAMGMIVMTPVLDQVDCRGIFTPIFQTTDGRLIQANPQVVEVKMAISKPENLGFHEAPLDHMEDTESLLYTKAEFEAYSEYLHASRAQKAITSAMTRKYCASTYSILRFIPTLRAWNLQLG